MLDKSKLSKKEFKEKLQTKDLKVSDKFGKVLKLEENPKIDESYFERFDHLPNDEVTIEEINEFLKKLVFVVNQPNEIELGKIIEAEMGEGTDINLIDSELVASKFQKDMLDWMKEKKGRFLTHEDGQEFFNEAKQKISKLVVIGPTLEYRAKIEAFGIAFSEYPIELRSFLNSNDKQIFNLISSHGTMLGSIKVYQTLKNMPRYQKDDSHIFMCLNSLLRIQDHAIQTLCSTTSSLLVIECKTTEQDAEQLYNQLSGIIQFNGNKKVILITQENNALAEKFKDNFSTNDKYDEKKDEKNSFIDITNASQKKLLDEVKVIFQGKEVNLGILIDEESKHLIDAEVLFKLVNNEKIEIGKAPTDSKFDDGRDYYIDRTFTRHIKIKEDFKQKKSKFFITYNDQFTESNLQQDQDIVLISDTGRDFEELCNKYKKHNIHWLKEESNEFTWQQSYGTSLSNLGRYLDDQNKNNIEVGESEFIKLLSSDGGNKVVIISAEPGMGKSTTLSNLAVNAKKTDPSLWVVRINLLDFASELEREERKNTKFNEVEAIKFLYRTIGFQLFHKKEVGGEKEREQIIASFLRFIIVKDSKISLEGYEEKFEGLSLLEIKLFNHFYNQGRIVFLFDGFDEVSPNYKNTVINLLEVLKDTKASRIWITTRAYEVQNELEDKLSVFSYSLKPLLEEKQSCFLREFWKANLKLSELDEQRSVVFIDELLNRFSESTSDQERKFVGIPLQIRMLAEIFQDMFKEFYDSNELKLSDEYKQKVNKELNLVTLYEKFIDIKFDKIRFGEKKPGTNTGDPDIKRMIETERKKFIENHRKLAVYGMFQVDRLKKLLFEQEITEAHDLIETITQGGEKTGIIDRVINNKPIFIHQTFAEYFTANYFWEKFKSIEFNEFENKFLNDVIIQTAFTGNKLQICKFFYLTAHRDLEKGTDFREKDCKIVTLLKSLLFEIKFSLYVRDSFSNEWINKNSNNIQQSIKLLFSVVEPFLLGKEAKDCKAIKDVIERTESLNLLCISAELGCLNFAKIFISTIMYDYKRSINKNEWYSSPLWLAAKNGHLDMVDLLKDIYDPNWIDRDNYNLSQCIVLKKEFNVRKSCLSSGIIDGKLAPSDVIKSFMGEIPENLLKYDREITELAIKKGIDFSVINLFFYEFIDESSNSPINELKFSLRSKYSLFDVIEKLLKGDEEYDYKERQTTTIQYAKQIDYIHKLLNGVHTLHNQKNGKSSRPLSTILKLIIDNVSNSSNFVGYKIYRSSQQTFLLPNYNHSSPSYFNDVGDSVSYFNDDGDSVSSFNDYDGDNEPIYFLPDYTVKLFSKSYKNSNTNLVEGTLDKLRFYIGNDAKEEVERFKRYPDIKNCNDILIGYEENLKLNFTNIEQKYKSLNKFESLNTYIHTYI